ncbi:MAG: hypothetical protein WCI53_00200 [Bacteroidota bacterium]|jgi:hypothetical protein
MNEIKRQEKELNPYIKKALDISLEQSFTKNLKTNSDVISSIKVWLNSYKFK